MSYMLFQMYKYILCFMCLVYQLSPHISPTVYSILDGISSVPTALLCLRGLSNSDWKLGHIYPPHLHLCVSCILC